MPRALSILFQGTILTTLTSAAAFTVWTKHSQFEPIDTSTDPTINSSLYKQYNPNRNPTLTDVCVRRIALVKIDPDLVKDADQGGSKLVDRFTQGVWGGFGYTIQRKYLEFKYRNDTTTSHQLWTKQQLLNSTYPKGTEVTDHFAVLSRTPKSIIFRCGDSPLKNPDTPRPSDGLFEISAFISQEGFAEFRLKSVFFQGEGKAEKAPFEGQPVMDFLHRMYAKLWMESALTRCKAKILDIDWEKVK